ncbi:hypothetical protein [uncultured Kiloniella sp.]|uniref:putative barnase/colicin E5 family endoribonuclease n=1 Tax=uncultured Kiloniella sp. TaxID=1133091 RepID=UPI00262682A3|nr:hypothetical protein [uncultured Kiloniella sp.]
MVQVIDHAEKLYGKPKVVQKAKRPRYQPTPLEQKVERMFGLEPGIRRAGFIPTPAGSLADEKGPIDWTDWTAPELLYGLAKTFTLPGHTLEGGSFTHQDTVDAAFNLTGGGFLSGAAVPKATTRGAAILSMNGARTPFYKRSTSTVKEFSDEIAKVLESKEASKGKVFREDLGEISFDFGKMGGPNFRKNPGYGLSHIIEKRTRVDGIDGENFVKNRLPVILASGRLAVIKGPANGRRALIETPKERVVLSLTHHNKRDVWVLSGYELR